MLCANDMNSTYTARRARDGSASNYHQWYFHDVDDTRGVVPTSHSVAYLSVLIVCSNIARWCPEKTHTTNNTRNVYHTHTNMQIHTDILTHRHTHRHTHQHTHTNTQPDTHTNTHSHTHTHTHQHTHTHTHTHTDTHTITNTHTHTHAHTHTHVHTYTHPHTHTHAHTHAHTHTLTRAHTGTRTHTHAHTHTCTHTHAHTHTHTHRERERHCGISSCSSSAARTAHISFIGVVTCCDMSAQLFMCGHLLFMRGTHTRIVRLPYWHHHRPVVNERLILMVAAALWSLFVDELLLWWLLISVMMMTMMNCVYFTSILNRILLFVSELCHFECKIRTHTKSFIAINVSVWLFISFVFLKLNVIKLFIVSPPPLTCS